jgi:membrane-associated phospholipid phosphatase
MLKNRRRALWYAAALLGALGFLLLGVGRHPSELAPLTTIPFLGRIDQGVYNTMQDLRPGPVTTLSRFLSCVGGGRVTTLIRSVASLVLALRRRWPPFVAFVLTWAGSEIVTTSLKVFFHRGRPSGPLVATAGFSFPSGHATSGAALAVALVLAFLPQGDRRRRSKRGSRSASLGRSDRRSETSGSSCWGPRERGQGGLALDAAPPHRAATNGFLHRPEQHEVHQLPIVEAL